MACRLHDENILTVSIALFLFNKRNYIKYILFIYFGYTFLFFGTALFGTVDRISFHASSSHPVFRFVDFRLA